MPRPRTVKPLKLSLLSSMSAIRYNTISNTAQKLYHGWWLHIHISPDKYHLIVIIFLPINLNICFGRSKELSH